MKRATVFGASLVAVLALVLTVTASALAGTTLVLKTARGALANGAPLEASSSNVLFATHVGNVECEAGTLSGTLSANKTSKDLGMITGASLTGDYENVSGACKTPVGPVLVTASGLSWKLELTTKGVAAVTGPVILTANFVDLNTECTYQAPKLLGTFPTTGGMTISFKEQVFTLTAGNNEVCPSSSTLVAGFSVRSNGEPVEAAALTSAEEAEDEPGTVSGTVTNGGNAPVDNVKVSVCEVETETCYSGETDVSGNYSIPGVKPGFYTATATPPAHSGDAVTSEEEDFLVTASETTPENITLTAAGSVTGEVSGENDAPVDHVAVTVCGESICYPTETEAGGTYAVSELPVGSYEILATPAAHSGFSAGHVGGFTIGAEETVTENITLAEAGSVSGTVLNTHSEPISGAFVSVCSRLECFVGVTGPSGSYTVEGVTDGVYQVTVSPETNQYNMANFGGVTVSGTGDTVHDFALSGTMGPPLGTEVSGTKEMVGGTEVTVVNWESEPPIVTQACIGGHVTATVTGTNVETEENETTAPATLAETTSGHFTGHLPKVHPIHGATTVTITVTGCAHPTEEESIEFTLYVDPSGVVMDANHGDAPVSGATVTLLSAPRLGGSFTAVENGSAVMSPANRNNPDTTGAHGEFGWDTIPGFYEVEASKPGCGSTVTPAFEVPPPVSNLELVLHCEVLRLETSGLPRAKREVHYEVQLVAGGEHAPFKWKKKGALPKGLKLSKTGVLSGTMKRKKVRAGVYAIGVEVKDAERHTATATLSLQVD